MRLALAQINTVVGDLAGNRERIVARIEEARRADADLVLFPELALTGYPPEDLLLRPGFMHSHTNSEIDFTEANEGNEAKLGIFLCAYSAYSAVKIRFSLCACFSVSSVAFCKNPDPKDFTGATPPEKALTGANRGN